jgi:hypothetical protein
MSCYVICLDPDTPDSTLFSNTQKINFQYKGSLTVFALIRKKKISYKVVTGALEAVCCS